MRRWYFTSESVTLGHPDKMCDFISDSILDMALSNDEDSKMAVETSIKNNKIWIFGEAKTKAKLNYTVIVNTALKKIGYNEEFIISVDVDEQSPEINNAVTHSDGEIGAGDQGIMFGYACNETDEYMPMPIYYANKLAKRLSDIQHKYDFLGVDGKTQVTIEYHNDKPIRVDTIVISTQHSKNVDVKDFSDLLLHEVIESVIDKNLIDKNTKILFNPSGSFVLGGPYGDSGTTGRKIICDTYGGYARIGGGCFSSKDPSKVDRSAAYYCRYVAKNVVAHGFASKCEIQVSYAIGLSDPLSIMVETFNTEKVSLDIINNYIKENFSFNVSNIIKELDLKKPIYAETAGYGHFGNDRFQWEKIV